MRARAKLTGLASPTPAVCVFARQGVKAYLSGTDMPNFFSLRTLAAKILGFVFVRGSGIVVGAVFSFIAPGGK